MSEQSPIPPPIELLRTILASPEEHNLTINERNAVQMAIELTEALGAMLVLVGIRRGYHLGVMERLLLTAYEHMTEVEDVS